MSADSARSAALLRLDRLVAFVAFLLLGALALGAPLIVAFSGMHPTGCANGCSTSLVGAGRAVIAVGCIGVTVVAFCGLLLLPHPNRYLWWLPCSALAIAGGIVLIGNHLIDLGAGA